ncbi:MAG: hypothetical protein AB2L07_18945 [Thermoanaerobaculaceae bacterium]
MLERLREHPDAPRWSYAVGDRLEAEDLPALDRFRAALAAPRAPRRPDRPALRDCSVRSQPPWPRCLATARQSPATWISSATGHGSPPPAAPTWRRSRGASSRTASRSTGW